MGKPIIADKKELLAQSSYLTRLNSQGCRETSRNKTAYIVSVTFNSDMFPKIKDRNSVYKQTTTAKVFQIIPNKEYKNIVTVLDESEIFKIDTDDVANIFRFFDAETKELICVGYADYENDEGQNALQAKPTKLAVRKIKGTTKLDVDTIFEHFLHDWAASFDLDNLYIIDKETSEDAKEIPIAKNESGLWAAKKRCGKDSNTLPWSTYDQGRVMDETVQKTYRLRGSNIDEDKIIAAYIGPQVFGDDFLKKLDIAGKSFRASPFKNSKLFKIYYSPNLTLKIFAGSWINQVENKLMEEARDIGSIKKENRFRKKLSKKFKLKPEVNETTLGGGAPAGQRQRLPSQNPIAFRDNIKPMIDNVIAGNFGQIEMLADLLAKNGYERYTITKIGNDDIGTIVNAFLNNPKNQDLINQFANLVKECHFRLDCKSRKQVQGKESLQDNDNQANRITKSKRIKDSYYNLQNTFNEFVKSQYFTNYEGKDFVIKDNYETLKKKYINFFIDLQQRVKRTRKGRGQLSINSKTAIKSEYDEDSQPSRLSRVGNFFMNLWSGFSERFKKKDHSTPVRHNSAHEPAVGTADNNESDAESVFDSNNESILDLPGQAAAEARKRLILEGKYIPGAYESVSSEKPSEIGSPAAKPRSKPVSPLPEIGSPAAKLRSKLVGPEKLPEPGPAAAAKPQNTSVTDLPKGWYKTVDSEGRPYYYNNSGRATWTKPTKPPQPTRTRARTRPSISPLTRVPDERAQSNDPKPESDKRPSIISRFISKKSTEKQKAIKKGQQALAEAQIYGTDPRPALQNVVSNNLSADVKKQAKEKQEKAEEKARSVWGKYYTGFGGSKTKKNTTKKNTTKKNVTKKNVTKKKVGGLKKRKGKKGKTHRAAKKTGRRYYLKTLKKRK